MTDFRRHKAPHVGPVGENHSKGVGFQLPGVPAHCHFNSHTRTFRPHQTSQSSEGGRGGGVSRHHSRPSRRGVTDGWIFSEISELFRGDKRFLSLRSYFTPKKRKHISSQGQAKSVSYGHHFYGGLHFSLMRRLTRYWSQNRECRHYTSWALCIAPR